MKLRILASVSAALFGGMVPAQCGAKVPDVEPLIECAGLDSVALPSERCMREEAFWSAQWAVQSSAAQALDAVNARFAQGTGELAELARRLDRTRTDGAYAERQYFSALALPKGAVRDEQLAVTAPLVERFKGDLLAIELELKDRFPEYSNLVAPQPLTAAQTQALLKPGEILVMVIPGQAGTFVFLVSKSSLDWHRSNLTRADLRDMVDDLRVSMGVDVAFPEITRSQREGQDLDRAVTFGDVGPPKRVGPAFDRSTAYQLYSELFGPHAAKLENVEHIYAVVSGPLSAFPLGALVTKEPKGEGDDPIAMELTAWLQRSAAITVLPAPTSLRALAERQQTQAQRSFLGVGNACTGWGIRGAPEPPPEICGRIEEAEEDAARDRILASNSGPGSGFSQVAQVGRVSVLSPDELRHSLTYLPGTRSELLQIADVLGADPERDLVMAQDASEAWIRAVDSRLSDYRIIVFATHGLVATDGIENLDEPGLVLTPPKVASTLNDGFLSASEIAVDLNLDADFVILSACNTASPTKSGADSLSGLARAFFYAGARSILVSHWPVLDDLAPRITTATINNFASMPQKGRAQAFKEALLPIMDQPETADPYFWAPFVLVGQN